MELFEALASKKRMLKMSFEDLSAASHVPVSTLKKIFTGVTANPPFETVRSIAYAMGITTDDLIDSMEIPADAGLSPAALDHARQYDRLDAHGRRIIDFVANEELSRIERDAASSGEYHEKAGDMLRRSF